MNKIRRLFWDGWMTKEARRMVQVVWPLLLEQLESTSDPGSDWIRVAPRLNAFSLIPCFLRLTLLHWEGDPKKKHGRHPGFALVPFWSVWTQSGNTLSHFGASPSSSHEISLFLLKIGTQENIIHRANPTSAKKSKNKAFLKQSCQVVV